jgi:hypothetical protein
MFSPCSKLKRIDITHINIRLSKLKISQSPRFTKTNRVGFEGKISNLSSTTTPSKIQFPCWEVLSFWSLIPADDITVHVYPWLTLKWGSKQTKELGQKVYPKLLNHYWFFHENHSFLAGSFIRTCQIFENFGILGMRRSFDFQNIRESKQKILSFWNLSKTPGLKTFYNQENPKQRLLAKFKNCTTLVYSDVVLIYRVQHRYTILEWVLVSKNMIVKYDFRQYQPYASTGILFYFANFRNPATKKRGVANPTKGFLRLKKKNSPYLDKKKT